MIPSPFLGLFHRSAAFRPQRRAPCDRRLSSQKGAPRPTSGPWFLRRALVAAEAFRGLWPILVFLFVFSGCAVRYSDPVTGTEHLWGFGHLKMRAIPLKGDAPPFTNAVIAFVTGVRTVGLTVGVGEDSRGIAAGWDSRSRLVITAPDAHFCLIWPTNAIRLPNNLQDLFTVQIQTNFPWITTSKPKERP